MHPHIDYPDIVKYIHLCVADEDPQEMQNPETTEEASLGIITTTPGRHLVLTILKEPRTC